MSSVLVAVYAWSIRFQLQRTLLRNSFVMFEWHVYWINSWNWLFLFDFSELCSHKVIQRKANSKSFYFYESQLNEIHYALVDAHLFHILKISIWIENLFDCHNEKELKQKHKKKYTNERVRNQINDFININN